MTICRIGGKLTTFEQIAKLKEAYKKSGVSLKSCVPVEKFQRAVAADMFFCSREYTRMAKTTQRGLLCQQVWNNSVFCATATSGVCMCNYSGSQ